MVRSRSPTVPPADPRTLDGAITRDLEVARAIETGWARKTAELLKDNAAHSEKNALANLAALNQRYLGGWEQPSRPEQQVSGRLEIIFRETSGHQEQDAIPVESERVTFSALPHTENPSE